MPLAKRLIIIDVYSLLFRAFHALPPLSNGSGQPTGAVYGFLLTLFKAIKDLKPSHIVACFDTAKPTFRHDQFQDYKIHRAPTPEGIVLQIPLMKKVLEALAVPMVEKEGFEADDLVATIAERFKHEALVYIISGDLDNLQLVDATVKLYTLGKGIKDTVIYDEQKVIERFGATPSQMNDFKALTGDASDNVPGVPGIGKTTAAALIKEFGSIAKLYEELSTDTALLKPKVKEALLQNREKAFLSLELVKTKRDIPLTINLESCKVNTFNQASVKSLFSELGFNSLVSRLPTLYNI